MAVTRSYTKNGESITVVVEGRTKKTKKEFADAREYLECKGLPFYESRLRGGTAEMPPDGFRDLNKSVGEWREVSRKLKPNAEPVAYIASWWQPMPNNPDRWVRLYHIDDTVFIRGRSVENIKMRFEAGDVLTSKEKALMLEADLGM